MTTSERRVLELAVIGLETERARIEQELADIRQRLGRAPAGGSSQTTSTSNNPMIKRRPTNKGKPMSAAQKRAISRTMKLRWAARKRAAANQ
jgi:hypothetical protein